MLPAAGYRVAELQEPDDFTPPPADAVNALRDRRRERRSRRDDDRAAHAAHGSACTRRACRVRRVSSGDPPPGTDPIAVSLTVVHDPPVTLDPEDQRKLEAATRLGKEVVATGRDSWSPTVLGVVVDEVSVVANAAKHVIQRIKLTKDIAWDGSEYAYKAGTFYVDSRTGDVKWAQYSQIISEREHRELLARARAKGWPILSD